MSATSPYDLPHEAYMRLVNVDKVDSWKSRGHFFGAAAEAMRRILIDNARRKKRLKHGGDWKRVELEDSLVVTDARHRQPTGSVSSHDVTKPR